MIANRIHLSDKLNKKISSKFPFLSKIFHCKLIRKFTRKKKQLKRIELGIEQNGEDNIFILLNFGSSRGFWKNDFFMFC